MNAEQAAAELAVISAAREAVQIAAQRIRVLKSQNMCDEGESALSDAADAVMDAFEDSLGQTENNLRDAGKVW